MVKKREVLNELDTITEMSDEEIALNAKWIRKVSEAAYALLNNKDQGVIQ